MSKRKRSSELKGKAEPWPIPALPPEGVSIPGPGMLKEVRQCVGLTQASLADECGLSVNVIVNYEYGRTKLDSVEDALRIWRVLDAKERALSTDKGKGPTAAQAVLGLLWLAKFVAQKRLVEVDGRIENLRRARQGIEHQIADIEAEVSERKRR